MTYVLMPSGPERHWLVLVRPQSRHLLIGSSSLVLGLGLEVATSFLLFLVVEDEVDVEDEVEGSGLRLLDDVLTSTAT
jgi:hypothetical protein